MVSYERFANIAHFGDTAMTAAKANPPDPLWVDARTAATMLGVPDGRNVLRLVQAGMITTRDLPGVRARYSRADVERLAAEGVREPRNTIAYLFDVRPEPGEDARLALALTTYKAERGRRRGGGATLRPAAAAEFSHCVGGLALRLVNRALDEDPDALPGVPGDGEGAAGAAARFWEALARLQT